MQRVLTTWGLPVFLPKLDEYKVGRRDQPRWTSSPLFPGYLFSQLDIGADDWLFARSAPGVSYILGHKMGETHVPVPVPDALVEQLTRRVAEENAVRRDRTFRPGDRVRLLSGPFQAMEAVFDRRLGARGRVQVLMAVLGRVTPLSISIDDLQRLP